MAKQAYRWMNVIVMALMVATSWVGTAKATAGDAAGSRCRMTLRNGKLTAHIATTPLRQILEELGRLSGVEIFVSGAEGDEEVSLEASDLPLTEAVLRILDGHNHALIYDARDGGRLTQIWVLPRAGATPDVPEAIAAALASLN